MAKYFNSRRDLATIVFAIVAGSIAGLIAVGAILPLMVLGTLAALYLVYLRAEIGVAALVFMTYINLSDVLMKYHGLPSIAKIYIPLLVLLLGVEWLRNGRRPWLPATGLAVLATYSLVLSLSFFYAADHKLLAAGFLQYSKDLTIALILALLVSSPSHFRFVLWSIISGALILGTLSVFKYLTKDLADDFGGFAQATALYWFEGQWNFRMKGSIGDANFFAQMLLIAVPISFERMLAETTRVLKFVAGCALLLSIVTIVLTYSRGGLVVLLMITPIALYRLRAHRKWLITGALLVVLALPLLPAGYIDRLTAAAPAVGLEVDESQSADSSTQLRVNLMTVAWEMFLDHPLLGVGYNNYETHYQKYALVHDLNRVGGDLSAHSLYLEIAAERGAIGLLFFGLLLFYLGKVSLHGWKAMKQAGFSSHADMIAGLAVGFLAYLLAAILLHDAYPRYFWMLAGLLLAVPGMVRNTLPRREEMA